MNAGRRGVAIIVVLLAMALLSVVALGLATMASGNLSHGFADHESQSALLGAEGAAWVKVAQLTAGDDAWIPMGATLSNQVIYGVDVYTGGNTAPNGFEVPAGCFYVLATAQTPRGTQRQFGIVGRVASTWWDMPAFAGNFLAMSEDASTKAYDSSLPIPDDADPTLYPYAHVGTNSLRDMTKKNVSGKKAADLASDDGWRGIYIDGDPKKGTGSRVGGDTWKKKDDPGLALVKGPPGSIESTVVVAGTSGANYAAFESLAQLKHLPSWEELGAPPVDTALNYDSDPLTAAPEPDVGGLSPGSYGDVNLTGIGKILYLNVAGLEGDAVFRFDKMQLSDDAELRILGYVPDKPVQVKVYVSDLEVNKSSLVNPTTRPSVLQVYSENDIHIEQKDTKAYFTAYAADDIRIEGEKTTEAEPTRLYGAVIARDMLNIEDKAEIWYDTTLLDEDTGGNSFVLLGTQRH
ncbi:MAG: hypothetical protein HY319_05380 [Armatimonadetes bacterium]|nr:hypothetical protein [Armatimonadota bacterium]